jgi:hypothetical protein
VRWQEQAACRGMDPAEAVRIFFVAVGESQAEAMDYCNACPVRQECLDDALTHSEFSDHGVRGGTSERRRRRIRAERAATLGLPERVCALDGCGASFAPHNPRQIYCTPEHTRTAAHRKHRARRRDAERKAS